MNKEVFAHCRLAVPGWSSLSQEDFDFADPKGFSSFTMGVRARVAADPSGVFYRRLAGKENAILDADLEKEIYLLLSEERLAARCLHYAEDFRVEALYQGRTLTGEDVFKPEVLRGIAEQLHGFHALQPRRLPNSSFFELLHEKWGAQAREVVEGARESFPEDERLLCDELREIYSEETRRKVARMLPTGPLRFCHNDTYHGNVMRLDGGDIRLLDFEFSCLNHQAFDFANLFAETVMEHGRSEPPHFRIAEPRFGDAEIGCLVDAYLDQDAKLGSAERSAERERLMQDTRDLIPLSDYMYAMAALPLAVEPIQKIRFIPYAHQRFGRFLSAYRSRFEP